MHINEMVVIVKLHYESPRNTYKFIVYLYVNSDKLKVYFFFISSYAITSPSGMTPTMYNR